MKEDLKFLLFNTIRPSYSKKTYEAQTRVKQVIQDMRQAIKVGDPEIDQEQADLLVRAIRTRRAKGKVTRVVMLSEPLACGGAATPEIAEEPQAAEPTRMVYLSEPLARGGKAIVEVPSKRVARSRRRAESWYQGFDQGGLRLHATGSQLLLHSSQHLRQMLPLFPQILYLPSLLKQMFLRRLLQAQLGKLLFRGLLS